MCCNLMSILILSGTFHGLRANVSTAMPVLIPAQGEACAGAMSEFDLRVGKRYLLWYAPILICLVNDLK
jgi:hypothetical protein